MSTRMALSAFGLALLLALTSLALGVREMTLATVLEAFTAFDETNADHIVVRELRLTRGFAAILAGAALGVSGALMQSMTRNPLADPGLLGINAGGAFGVVLGIWGLQITAPGGLVIPALVGATVTSLLVLILGSGGSKTGPDPVRMVLVGAALSALFLSLTWGLLILARQTLDIYRYWVLGGFQQVDPASMQAVLPLFVAGFVLAGLAAFLLNPLALGDDTARALGARVGFVRALTLCAIVLLCATTVSLAGPIAFLGLLVPHLVRPFARGDVRRLAMGSAALGAILAILADLLGRMILPGQELEAGVIMALIGGPFLIAMVQRRQAVSL
ncbi:MAG: iron ABC transporter permease [Pseudomonadota bacterium]